MPTPTSLSLLACFAFQMVPQRIQIRVRSFRPAVEATFEVAADDSVSAVAQRLRAAVVLGPEPPFPITGA